MAMVEVGVEVLGQNSPHRDRWRMNPRERSCWNEFPQSISLLLWRLVLLDSREVDPHRYSANRAKSDPEDFLPQWQAVKPTGKKGERCLGRPRTTVSSF